MRNNHADPTAGAAVGAADREWFRLVKLAMRMREKPELAHDPKALGQFTGIYRRLLEEPYTDLERILKKQKQ